MPLYQWFCPTCGHDWTVVCSISEYDAYYQQMVCEACGDVGRREWSSVQFARVMQEYVHPQFGTVSDPKHYHDALARQSAAQSLRTGIDHNYQLADPFDTKTLGVDDATVDQVIRSQRPPS